MRISAAVLLWAVSGTAAAGSCAPIIEYAQAKDRAKTSLGRQLLAVDYCAFFRLGLIERGGARIECESNQRKIMDALTDAKDADAIGKANDCVSDALKKQMEPTGGATAPQPSKGGISRCVLPNGSTVYSNASCESQGGKTIGTVQR